MTIKAFHEQKDLQQNKNKKLNETNSVIIEKEYEMKNFYFDNNGNNITNDEYKWINTQLNKSIIRLLWDNVNNIFSLDFSFLSKNAAKNIEIKINNKEVFDLTPSYDFKDNMYNYNIYSTNLGDGLYDIKNLNILQITLKGDYGSKIINLALGDYIVNKNDFLLDDENGLCLKFQKDITIKGEEIKSSLEGIQFSSKKIKQGYWNQEFLEIYEENNEVFKRNDISIVSLTNIPISSNKYSQFDCYYEKVNNNIGIVKISQNTYYDLLSKETKRGLTQNSKPGYILPFEFSGTFMPKLNLKINMFDFEISWKQEINKPFFKGHEGKNKIYLSNSYNKDNNYEWNDIDLTMIEEAMERNLTFDEFLKWIKK